VKRLLENHKLVNHIVPAVRTAGTTNATGIDVSLYDEATFIVSVGAIGNTGTDTTLNVKIQECDESGGTYVDITGAAITELVYTNDDAIASIGVNLGLRTNRKKYVRAVAVVAGSDSVAFGVEALLKAETMPVVNSPASVLV
jgi:hypothetical protein